MTRPHEDVIREALAWYSAGLGGPADRLENALSSLAALVDERDRLREERVKHIPDECAGHYRRVMDERDEWKARADRLREALAFYAKDENWDSTLGPFPRATRDGGRVAREALAASPGDKTPEASGPDEPRPFHELLDEEDLEVMRMDAEE